jgi:hypothetical protein
LQYCGTTKSLGIASSNGSTLLALDDRGVCSSGGMINGTKKTKMTGKKTTTVAILRV